MSDFSEKQLQGVVEALRQHQRAAGVTSRPLRSPSKAVVLDNGSGMMKLGFAGDDNPRVQLPAVVGRDKRGVIVAVGKEAAREGLTVSSPVTAKGVSDWDGLRALWKQGLGQLRVAPEEHNILLVVPSAVAKEELTKLVEGLFRWLKVEAAFVIRASMFPSIDDRREGELGGSKDVTLWRGGAGLASLSTFEEMWIPRDEYDESGPGIVLRKCT